MARMMSLVIAAALLVVATAAGSNNVMPWMCLERCNATTEQVARNLEAILAHGDTVDWVSYERYNLGADGTLVVNTDLTNVGPKLVAAGIKTLPMVSSWPYPPAFLDWMRALFRSPDAFIADAIKHALEEKHWGFNIDFEPTVRGTQADAEAYVAFLNTFADALHAHGLVLTVDYATWNPVWNATLLAASRVDAVATMCTYVANDTTWLREFRTVLAAFGVDKLAVGLQVHHEDPITAEQVRMRIDHVLAGGVRSVGIWRMSLPDYWWPELDRFISSGRYTN